MKGEQKKQLETMREMILQRKIEVNILGVFKTDLIYIVLIQFNACLKGYCSGSVVALYNRSFHIILKL